MTKTAVSAEPGSTITLCDDQPLLNQYGEDLNTTVHVYGGGCKTGLLENPVGGSMMDLSGISCVRNSHGNTQTGIKPPKTLSTKLKRMCAVAVVGSCVHVVVRRYPTTTFINLPGT